MVGRFQLRLNINMRPTVNKYREGKMKRTLKRGLKVPEIIMGEANTPVQCFPGDFVYVYTSIDAYIHRYLVDIFNKPSSGLYE